MGRAPCCDKANVKKGPWSPEEDLMLKEYIEKYGTGGNWIALPQKVGLKRCGKSCRLRWLNYLRPNIKHGEFSDAEDRVICTLFASIGSRWSVIAAQLPGRTDNDIKNYWNTKLKKKLMFSPLLLSSATAQPVSSKLKIKPHHNYQSTVTTTTFTSSPPSSYCVSSPLSVATADRSCFSSGLDPVSSSDLLSPPYAFHPMRETLLMNNTFSFQFQQPCPPEAANLVKENNNLLMVGGHEASSCSSSDGSSGNLHMSHGNKDRDFDYGSEQQQLGLGFPSCISYPSNNGGGTEENNKLMMMMMGNNTESEWTNNEKPSKIWSESDPASLEYYGSIEEIKQLLSSNNNSSSIITADEIKTGGQEEEIIAMYY